MLGGVEGRKYIAMPLQDAHSDGVLGTLYVLTMLSNRDTPGCGVWSYSAALRGHHRDGRVLQYRN